MKKPNITQKYTQFTKIVEDLKTRFADNSNILETIDANATKVWNAFVKTALPIALVVSMLVGLVACSDHSGLEQIDINKTPILTESSPTLDSTIVPSVTNDPNITTDPFQTTPGETNIPIITDKPIIVPNPGKEPIELDNYNIRPIEDIQASRVTAEDVLAYYDQLVTKLAAAKTGVNEEDVLSGKFDAQLNRVNRNIFAFKDAKENEYSLALEFIARENTFTPNHSWLNDQNSSYYNPTPEQNEHVFLITLFIDYNYDNKGYNTYVNNIAVPYDEMHKIINAFNVEKYVLTEEKAQQSLLPQIADKYTYDEVYKLPYITRDVITNATQEQLDALFETIKAIEDINLHGKSIESSLSR